MSRQNCDVDEGARERQELDNLDRVSRLTFPSSFWVTVG